MLEVGFGPGVAIQYAAERAMLEIARTRNASVIAKGVVNLRKSDVQSLPYADDSFERICHSLRVLLARTGGVPTGNQTRVAVGGRLVRHRYPYATPRLLLP